MNDDTTTSPSVTRRQVLAAAVGTTAIAAVSCAPAATGGGGIRAAGGGGGASAAAGAGAASGHAASTESSGSGAAGRAAPSARMPVVYLPHGGGPWPFVALGVGTRAENDALAGYLRSVRDIAPTPPRAVLMISAHWEEPVPTVMSGARPPLLYDYYGFPAAAYEITWPAPGEPALAARVRELLGAAGLETAENAERGFDHGTFIPLKLTYPDADVPTVQLSLVRGLDPAVHIALGRALAPLRDEGVLIVGSGLSYHNMRGFGGGGARASVEFDAWLQATATADASARDEGLRAWAAAPSARAAHPREEHLLPLMVIAGAAGEDRGRTAYSGTWAGVALSAFHFG